MSSIWRTCLELSIFRDLVSNGVLDVVIFKMLSYVVLPVRIIFVRVFITCVGTGTAKLFFMVYRVRMELVEEL